MNTIQMIKGTQLVPHPQNPRKDLGDLTELTESIRKNGIMQNLSVVPLEDGRYQIVIGHRRYAAGMAAGLNEFPCIITDMDEREQLCTMMEENMQRQDLTIPEQAYGFQYMLDLGETVDQIASRTGFSEQTVRHRLEIAKLNKKTLKKATKDENWQMTISDLMELEKIKDIKRRNKVLEDNVGRDRNNFRWAVKRAVADEKKDEHRKGWMELITAADIKEDKKFEHWGSGDKYQILRKVDLEEDKAPKTLKLKKTYENEPVFWKEQYSYLYFFQKKQKQKEQLTAEELKKKEKEAREKKLGEKCAQALKEMRMAAQAVYEGTVELLGDELQAIGDIVLLAEWTNAGIHTRNLNVLVNKKHSWEITQEERKEIEPKLTMKPVSTKLLVWMAAGWTTDEYRITGNYYAGSKKETLEKMNKIYDMLHDLYGFTFSDPEYDQILDGTHELYDEEEEKQ